MVRGENERNHAIVNEVTLTTFAIGSFIAFPALGSGSNTITVYAENRINVERTLRSLNYLVRMMSLFSITRLIIIIVVVHRSTRYMKSPSASSIQAMDHNA